jgi:hypothetical protein
LVRKIYRFDLKLNNKSTWKAKYIFSSPEIRKSILNWKIKKNIFNENIVYNTLMKSWKSSIYTWKNWTFIFSFIFDDSIVHVSENTEKNEIKKEINKLKKIEWNYNKYLIVNSIKEIWIRTSTYLPVKVLEIKDFLNIIKN